MSQIKLKHSGGNSVIIAAPDSNPASDRTLKLPSDADGTILTTNSSVGKVLQIQETVKNDTTSANVENTWQDISGMSVSITPASASNKILVLATVNVGVQNGHYYALRLQKGGSPIFVGATSGNRSSCFAGKYDTGSNYYIHTDNMHFTDTAGGTSAITYNIGWYNPYQSNTRYLNRTADDSDNDYRFRTASSITVIEVAA